MLTRQQVLGIIDTIYEARQRADTQTLDTFWGANATYALAGAPVMIPAVSAVPTGAVEAVRSLVGLFHFHGMSQIDSIVEGPRAMIRWNVTVSCRGCDPVETEICDVWTFDQDGKVSALVQFADTALIAKMLS